METRFHTIRLPNPIRDETSIRMRVSKQQPFLKAQNFHHKLQILLEAIIGCKTSSETCRSHDYFQYDRRAYHCIAAFNGAIAAARWLFTLAYHVIFK